MKKKTITIAALTLVLSGAVMISVGKPMKEQKQEVKMALSGSCIDPFG